MTTSGVGRDCWSCRHSRFSSQDSSNQAADVRKIFIRMLDLVVASQDYLFHDEQDLEEHQNLSVDIDEDVFAAIDTDGDGMLSRDEYRAYVLMKHGLISKDVLDSIDLEYEFLRKSSPGGSEKLTWDAVKARAEEIRLRRAARSKAKGAARRGTHVVPVRQASTLFNLDDCSPMSRVSIRD